ncbi:MAG: YciI family protein [Myxococcota bacterium]
MTLQYAILIYESEADQQIRETDGPEQAEVQAGYSAYTDALVAAGKMRGGERLDLPHTATTVAARPGQALKIQDGPFADTKDQLAGFYIIEANDLDDAIAWAARCPAARTGRIEVRPVLPRSLD